MTTITFPQQYEYLIAARKNPDKKALLIRNTPVMKELRKYHNFPEILTMSEQAFESHFKPLLYETGVSDNVTPAQMSNVVNIVNIEKIEKKKKKALQSKQPVNTPADKEKGKEKVDSDDDDLDFIDNPLVSSNWADEMEAVTNLPPAAYQLLARRQPPKIDLEAKPVVIKPDAAQNLHGKVAQAFSKVMSEQPYTKLEKYKALAAQRKQVNISNSKEQSFTYNVESTVMASSLKDLVYYFFEDQGVTFTEIKEMLAGGQTMAAIRNAGVVAEWRNVTPFAPKPDRIKGETIKEVVRSLGITRMLVDNKELIKIPGMVEIEDVPMPESPWTIGLRNFYKNELVPDILGSTMNQASFNPQYEVIRPYMGVLAHLESIRLKGDDPHIRSTMERLRSVAEKHYFGNGCIKGQLGRLKACREVADNVMPSIKPSTIDPVFIFGEPNKIDWIYTSFLQGIDVLNLSGTITNKINLEADAGVIWRKAKKSLTTPLDFQMADDIMHLLNGEFSAEDIMQQIPSLRLLPMKPKSEVYERAEYDTKTRNIFPANAFIMLPLQTILTLALKDTNNFLTDSHVKHLLGFSPFHGGTNEFIQQIVKSDSNLILTYSDNLYGKSGDIYFSADGSKQEATITKDDVITFNKYLYDRCGLANSPMAKAWYEYLVNLVPNCIVDTIGLLGSYQFFVKGMVSGATGTTYYNTYKMGQFCHLMGRSPVVTKNHTGYIFTDDAKKNMRAVGLVIKLETAQDITPAALEEGFLKLDLLGYDAVQIGMGVQGYMPVLDPTRLDKAIMFPRHEFSLKHQADIASMLKFVRYRALYLMGGWYDPSISLGIRSYLNEARKHLPSDKVRQEDLLLSISDVLSEVDILESMISFVDKSSIPSMYEMISLCLNPQQAENFITYAISKNGDVAYLALSEEFKAAAHMDNDQLYVGDQTASDFLKNTLLEEIIDTEVPVLGIDIAYNEREVADTRGYVAPVVKAERPKTKAKNDPIQPHTPNQNKKFSKELLEYLSKTPVFKFKDKVEEDSKKARAIITHYVATTLRISATELIKSFAGDKRLSLTEGADLVKDIETFK